MNVSELIERLSEMDPDAEVRIATQPSWPLQSLVHGVVASTDLHDALDDVEAVFAGVVWIVEGGHPLNDSPYAPGAVFDAV